MGFEGMLLLSPHPISRTQAAARHKKVCSERRGTKELMKARLQLLARDFDEHHGEPILEAFRRLVPSEIHSS
ncbi:hypothetical protein E4U17_005924, partial [Claviceps sp. LM77 group G4]